MWGRVFGLLNAQAVETSFRHWVSGMIPAPAPGTVVAVGWQDQPAQRAGGTALGEHLGLENCGVEFVTWEVRLSRFLIVLRR